MNRFITRQDFYAGLAEWSNDWAVYDLQRDSETPVAVFARRSDAWRWARERNR